MKLVRVGVPVVALVVVLSVAGCAGASPQAAPSSSPFTAAPTSSPVSDPMSTPGRSATFDTIELDSKQLELISNDATVGTLPLTDTAQAVAALSASLGDPTILKTPVDHCSIASASYEWGGAIEITDLAAPVSATTPDFAVRLLKSTVESRDGDTITVQGIDGVKVGLPLPAPATSLPFSKAAGAVLLEPGWTTSTDHTIGAAAFVSNGVVTAIGSPVDVGPQSGDC